MMEVIAGESHGFAYKRAQKPSSQGPSQDYFSRQKLPILVLTWKLRRITIQEMKTIFSLTGGLLALSSVAVMALSTVPDSYPSNGDTPGGDGNNVVVIYENNQVGLVTTLPDSIADQLAAQPMNPELLAELEALAGTPVTEQKIANALAQMLAANPANAVSATAMAIVLASRAQIPVEGQTSIISRAVQTLASQSNGNLPSIATLIGFAAQISPPDQRASVISELRSVTITNLPQGDIVGRSLALDSVLVQLNVLQPITISSENFGILLARANLTSMTGELITPFSSLETQVGNIAESATTAGEGTGSNAFGSGGAIGTPDNPAGVSTQPPPPAVPTPTPTFDPFPIPPGPTPTPPTPAPTPTPPPPYGS
jgi:hypothetical protein